MALYVLFHCDEWHTYASFRLIGVVDEAHKDKALKRIKREQGYSDEEMETYIHVSEIDLNDLDI